MIIGTQVNLLTRQRPPASVRLRRMPERCWGAARAPYPRVQSAGIGESPRHCQVCGGAGEVAQVRNSRLQRPNRRNWVSTVESSTVGDRIGRAVGSHGELVVTIRSPRGAGRISRSRFSPDWITRLASPVISIRINLIPENEPVRLSPAWAPSLPVPPELPLWKKLGSHGSA